MFQSLQRLCTFFFTYDKVLHLFRLSFFFYVLPSFEERSQNIQVLPLQLCDLSAYSFYLPCFAFFGLQHITCFSFFFFVYSVFVTSETTHRRQKQQYTKNGSRVRSAALDGLETKSTVCVALKKKEEF